MEETILQTLKDHTSEVTSCDISQSNVLASAAGDKSVHVYEWNVGQGFVATAYSPLRVHKYGVTCVRFSPRGTLLASASLDGTTVIWNVKSGCQVHTLVQGNRSSVRRVEFTPDSSRLITAGDNGVFCIWDLFKGSLLRSHRVHDDEENACIQGLSVSSDGQLLVTGDTGGLLQIFGLHPENVECLTLVKNVNDGITCCAFSPCRSNNAGDCQVVYKFATSGCDSVVRLWNVTIMHGEKESSQDFVSCDIVEVSAFCGHSSDVHDIRFNAIGTFIASIGLDKDLRIWEVSSGNCLRILTGHSRYGNCCAFTKDSSLVVTGSNDKTLIIWNVEGNVSLESNLSPVCNVASHFTTEPTMVHEELMAGNVEEVAVRHKLLHVISAGSVVNSVAFGGNRVLAVGGRDKAVRVWKRTDADDEWLPAQELHLHNYSINQLAFSPCGTRIITCAMDGSLSHWDLQTDLSFLLKTDNSLGTLRTCAFSSTDLIASAGDDEVVFLWNASSLEFICKASEHRDAVTDLAFSTDGELLASTCVAGDVAIYHCNTNTTCLIKDNVHDLGAMSCHFAVADFLPASETPTQYVLATCGNDSFIRIWRIFTGVSAMDEHTQLSGHGGNVMLVRFSPATPYLVASSATDNTARIWNAKTGDCVVVVDHHTSMVNTCAFSQDGSLLATGSLDRTAAIWRLPTHNDMVMNISKRVQHWSSDDFGNWLRDIGYPAAGEKVKEASLTGRQLLQLDEMELLQRIGMGEDENSEELAEILWWGKKSADFDCEQVEGAPHQFLCPITHDIMRDPVICSDGFTYERAAIMEWMVGGRFTSPMTNEAFSENSITPNAYLKKSIYKFLYGQRPK